MDELCEISSLIFKNWKYQWLYCINSNKYGEIVAYAHQSTTLRPLPRSTDWN